MNSLDALKIKFFADGADQAEMLDLYRNPLIKGLSTNPKLMREAGVVNYEIFAREVLETVKTKPISFDVFADDFAEMRRQALRMRDWQENVYVKIPALSTRGESAMALIRDLVMEGVKLNVTAILSEWQMAQVANALLAEVPSVVSIFAGEIADTGRNPVPVMRAARWLLREQPRAELLWASVREVFNIFQAAEAGAQIVTVPHDLLHTAIEMCGRDLDELSLETVKTFDRDAKASGYRVVTGVPDAGVVPVGLQRAA